MWSHIADLFYEDLECGLHLLPRLTYNHIKLNSCSVMNVKLAAQILSSTVTCTLQKFGPPDAQGSYNMLFSDLRMATSEATLNSRLMIHWNGVATAKFDPRPSVQAFLTAKDRRMNLPKLDSYRERDFVKKFFG